MPAIPYDRLAMPGTITPSDQRPHRAPGPRFPSPPPGADPLPPRIGESAPPGPPTGGNGLPTHIAHGPTSLIVYGPSLSVVNLTLYAFAHAANPKFLWVNIRARNEPIFAGDPAALGWVPREQLLTFDRPEALRPNATVAAAAVSQLIAADEPTTSLNRLLEFVQLPDFTQCLLAEKPSDGRPGLLAVPNTHALTSTFTTTRVEAIIDAHVQAGYSLFVGYPERFDGHHRAGRTGAERLRLRVPGGRREFPELGRKPARVREGIGGRPLPGRVRAYAPGPTVRGGCVPPSARGTRFWHAKTVAVSPRKGGPSGPPEGRRGGGNPPVEGDLPSPWRLGLPGGLAGLLEDLGELAKTPGEDNGGRDHARGQGDECC